LSWLYFTYRALPSVGGLFYGINPVVVVLIVITAWRLGKSAITDWKLLLIALGSFLGSVLTPVNEALILLAAGAVGILLYGPPLQRLGKGLAALLPLPLSLAANPALPTPASLALVFLKAGSLLFGTGFVIIPLLAPDVVETYRWMTQKEFFDGVTLGQVTPGPIVKTATFVGFKAGGLLGAAVATVAIFLPPFVLVLSLAPILKRLRQNPWLQGFLRGVRPGAVGTILGIVVAMAQAAFVDWWTVGIAAASLLAFLRFRMSTPLLVVGAGIVGVLVRSLF
jgi:chromate transporter